MSVCLLTRNEEKNLERVLRSVAGLASEIIIADTGSTDGTVQTATALGARVSHFPWDDDFAAGRNDALDHATGDWILWLNPDEELLPASVPTIRGCLSQDDALAFAVTVQEVMKADDPASFSITEQLRLFRRHPEVRYAGRLHPDFAVPLQDLAQRLGKQVAYAPEIVLRHHAYLSILDEGKLRWAARLLERELADRPGQLHFLIEYGLTLLRLNDPRGHAVLTEAVEQLLPQRTAPAAPAPAVGQLLEYLLKVAPAQSRSRLSPEEAVELALRWFPHTPPLLWSIAQYEFQKGDFRQAAQQLVKLVQCGQTGVYDRSAAFDPALIGASALLNLASCSIRLGQLDQAEQCLRPLLDNPAHQAQASQNLALIETLRRRQTEAGKAPGAP